MNCQICESPLHKPALAVKEMMFGFRKVFDYLECEHCGCLQIAEIPENLSDYYPATYYSFDSDEQKEGLGLIRKMKDCIRLRKFKYAVFKNGFIGKLAYNLMPDERFYALSYMDKLNKNDSILDVGCGSGYLIKGLQKIGFQDLTGIDPFIREDLKLNDQLRIYKKYVSEAAKYLGKFDLIMLHHSFEHMSEPESVMNHIAEMLQLDGVCMIRIPVADSFAFEKYRENWVQLDAPRHFFLHTNQSMQILAQKTGLTITKIVDDSNTLQFWGSEQYLKDKPLFDRQPVWLKKLKYLSFLKFRRLSMLLNQQGKGDQRIFILKKSKSLA